MSLSGEGMMQDEIDRCKQVWGETLRFFGQPRPITRSEEEMIGRAIQAEGEEIVRMALLGARFEPVIEHFNPALHVDLARILLKDREGKPRIQRFVGLGAQYLAREAKRKENEARMRAPAHVSMAAAPDLTPDPEGMAKIREIVSRIGRGST